MSSEVIIETRNLTKVYRDFWGRPKVQALKALDLQVHRGEIFGLLGPNGSGKTTTIKLLLGLVFPTQGEALIFNEPTSNVAKNERIGYLPEESYLYKFLNAEETLHFYGRLFKMSFDPYHCIELRWGAEGDEGRSCPDNKIKLKWYTAEQRLRNQPDRTYDIQMGFDLEELGRRVNGTGIDTPPAVDIKSLIESIPDRVPLTPMKPGDR